MPVEPFLFRYVLVECAMPSFSELPSLRALRAVPEEPPCLEDEMAQEECGVVMIVSKDGQPIDRECAYLLYLALIAVQHRGVHGCGIAVPTARGAVVERSSLQEVPIGNGEIHSTRGDGRVTEKISVYDLLHGFPSGAMVGIAHTRWATTGGKIPENQQPIVHDGIVGAINGNSERASDLGNKYYFRLDKKYSDTNWIVKAIATAAANGMTLEEAVTRVLEDECIQGSTYVGMFARGGEVVVARDPEGRRPAILGTVRVGEREYHVIASETVALEAIGATVEQEIPPGAVYVFENGKMRVVREGSYENHRFCSFEHMYFCHPSSRVPVPEKPPQEWPTVEEVRESVGRFMGNRLRETLSGCDLIVPLPKSGVPFARGLANGAGMGEKLKPDIFVKFRRTFIEGLNPKDTRKMLETELILNPDLFPGGRDVYKLVDGKHIVICDDSTIIGNTAAHVIQLLKGLGAASVTVVNSMPAIAHDCVHGSDLKPYNDRLFNRCGGDLEKMAEHIGASAILYPDYETFVRAVLEATGRQVETGADQNDKVLFGRNGLCGECFATPCRIPRQGQVFPIQTV